jgi:hypothetical protein
MFSVTGISAPDAREAARITAVLRPVRIGDGVALSATPTNLDAGVLAAFAADEIVPDGSRPRLRHAVAEIEGGRDPVAECSQTFTLYRHLCETADQWSGIAIPDLTAAVRESLAVAAGHERPVLTAALAQPLRQLSLEFRRAGFFLDQCTDHCRAYERAGEVAFVHRICTNPGADLMATVVERFPA